ncbi:hypothetical protein GLAREA_11091 [Glarea lozoyensis ATCC 20868]|uniref:Uncharacterized protein n=1 Tax=Glarea lozoyensis (strain ATCC 20868 / MF5171) TaxID=1116229 RepID=S3DAB7_GLAL2|nr:uncharacterized protein GLAREA_11091 [Glarea lozoyensis ATCC 20868]EPE35392.1 hypothetical protein GLAREA_11091 [Glarea lozoyensis ATCC 20868]
MGAFGNMDLGSAFGIVLGCLIALSFLAGLVKVLVNRRRLAHHVKLDAIKAKEKGGDKEMINQRVLDEGDLFGVRALEGGYFGGVSQSRPSSPSPSYVLAPQTVVTDWSNTNNQPGNLSTSSSQTDLHSAGVSTPKKGHKPSPLRLHEEKGGIIGVEVVRPPLSPSASSVGGKGGAYMPPTGKLSPKGIEPAAQKAGWVSPLDVHFSKPQTPTSPSTPNIPRPHSYLPRMNFPVEKKQPNSEVGSIIGSEISQYTTKSDSKGTTAAVEVHSPTRGPDSISDTAYHPYIPSRGGRETSRSIFPAHENRDRSSSRSRGVKNGLSSRSPTNPVTRSPPVPLTPPRSGSSMGSGEQRPEDDEQAVIRDSATKRQRVSVSHRSEPSQENITSPKQASIIAPQAVYQNPFLNRIAGSSESIAQAPRKSRSRSTSVSTTRSSTSLSRTRDSIRRSSPAHIRKSSAERFNRHSRDRDQLHYDPTSHHRSRAGSVQGRAVDFDHPRESPFSNSNAITTNSANHSIASSVSSFESAKQHNVQGLEQRSFPAQQVRPQGPTHLAAPGRGRSESEGSQASISDFYDSYYRQSVVPPTVSSYNTAISTRRDSATIEQSNPHMSLLSNNNSPYPMIMPSNPQGNSSQAPTPPPRSTRRRSSTTSQSSSEGNQSTINPGFDFTTGRKGPPLPLSLRPLNVGETIIEMPTPHSGPSSAVRTPRKSAQDQFPARV